MALNFAQADTYFKNRMKNHPAINDLDLWTATIRQSNNPVKDYISIMNAVNKNINMKVDWSNLPDDPKKIVELWTLRECIVALSFITADALINSENVSIQIGSNPRRKLPKDHAQALIMGSTTLLSDIDVTVLSPNASIHIALIEDLWTATNWFDHSAWKVDLYGDFTMIGEYYLDTRFISDEQKIQSLVLATASYFRHENSNNFDTSVLEKIINWCIHADDLDIDSSHIINSAKTMVNDLKYADREIYYKQLRKAEHLKQEIINNFSINNKSEELGTLLGECLVVEGLANLHREENYILVPTVIHVVKVEQGKEDVMTQCKPLKVKVARCSMSAYVYALSAIEQLGYMQENLGVNKICTMAAGKYFGRLLRALAQSLFENDTQILKDDLDLANDLAKEKKLRGNAGIQDVLCEQNLLVNIKNLFL